MKKKLIVILIVLAWGTVFSQTTNKYSKKRQKLFEQLDFADNLLSEADEINYDALIKLNIIKNKITYRKAIVETFNKEISLIDEKVKELKTEQKKLKKELSVIKKEYEQLIYYAYKNRSAYDKLMFIMSAETFLQAYKRLKYLEQYTNYRKKQVAGIALKNKQIDKTIIELEEEKFTKLKLIDKRLAEQKFLEKEKKQEEELVEDLKDEYPTISDKYENSQTNEKELTLSVSSLITNLDELSESASAIAEMESKESDKIITKNFAKAKGKLVSPVNKGIVVSKFGSHTHPDFPNLKIQNDGVDILTTNGSVISAVFTGKVTKIIDIPSLNKSILIKHGDYYSLYSNIINVNVTEGEIVEKGHEIGIIFTDKFEKNSSILKFQIWYKKEKLNPEKWISTF